MSKKLITKILSQTATSIEKEMFQEWLNKSQENRDYFDQSKVLWQKLDGIYSHQNFDHELANKNIQRKAAKLAAKTIRIKWQRRIAIAASIVIVIGLSLFIRNLSLLHSSDLYVSTNSVKLVELVDGTKIWLNKNSSVEVPWNYYEHGRKVKLSGEAFFQVYRDESKPFSVTTGKTNTRVLGTSFNLKENIENGNVDLDVATGKVLFQKLKWQKKSQFLVAGEQAEFNNEENTITILENKDLNYLSWKTGELKFYETPLDQVCKDLTNYFGVNIKSNIINSKLTLSGNFRDDNLENILQTIELSLDIKVNKYDDVFVLESATTNLENSQTKY